MPIKNSSERLYTVCDAISLQVVDNQDAQAIYKEEKKLLYLGPNARKSSIVQKINFFN